ncbi:MAG: hypothetical protein IBJ10_09320 [Phycisphaerales bacterium]|nr:hypothetical protein [Phycisphaerales bacterium]
MTFTVTIRNQRPGLCGDDRPCEWEFSDERVTVRELIRRWVYEEVDDYNRGLREAPIAPGAWAWVRVPDADLPPPSRSIDWRREFDAALAAYERRAILVLVGPRETLSLDEVVTLASGTEVIFLQLTPIVGRG